MTVGEGVRRRWVPVALLLAIAAVLAAWMLLAAARPANVDGTALPDLTFVLQLTTPLALVGFVVARRVPENRIGWLFLAGPLLAATGFLLIEIAVRLQTESAAWVFYVGDALFFTGIGLLVSQFLVRFPTGRPVSRRWSVVAIGGLIGVVLNDIWFLSRECVVFVATSASDVPTPSCSEPAQDWFLRWGNPFGLDPGVSRAMGVVGAVGALLLLSALFLGAISLVFRYRAAGPGERAQLRWLLAAVAVLGPAFFGLVAWEGVTGSESGLFGQILVGLALMAIPMAVGVAITRHRLYDIDRLIKRTVAYALIGVIVGGGFVAAVMIPVLVLGVGDDATADNWMVALATLVAFVLFDPVRRRVQRFVDRRFDRQRYDAGLVLDGFGAAVLNVTEAAAIGSEFAGAADRMLRPSSVSIWLSEGPP